jgi:hypothetical protein
MSSYPHGFCPRPKVCVLTKLKTNFTYSRMPLYDFYQNSLKHLFVRLFLNPPRPCMVLFTNKL